MGFHRFIGFPEAIRLSFLYGLTIPCQLARLAPALPAGTRFHIIVAVIPAGIPLSSFRPTGRWLSFLQHSVKSIYAVIRPSRHVHIQLDILLADPAPLFRAHVFLDHRAANTPLDELILGLVDALCHAISLPFIR
jgi:hypothetical protein